MTAEPHRILESAAGECWPVVVVGGGPAGTLVARELARRDVAVLLLERHRYPRRKVCGCCLNRASLAVLERAGLGDLPSRLGGEPLGRLRLYASGRSAELALPDGMAVSRSALDQALAEEARAAGVQIIENSTVQQIHREKSSRHLTFRSGGAQQTIEARVVILACGLGARLTPTEPEFLPTNARDARIGAAVMIRQGRSTPYSPGVIHMTCARSGYVGLVIVEDGYLNVAAALRPDAVRAAGGLGPAACSIIAESGAPALPGLEDADWKGSPLLTQRVGHVAGRRLFLVGDAAGYVEPFTGEGMAWALAGGLRLGEIAFEAARGWSTRLAECWTREHRRLVRQRQGVCRATAWAVRHPAVLARLLTLTRRWPKAAGPFIRYINRTPGLRQARAAANWS